MNALLNRTDNADFWVDDKYLQLGLEKIVKETPPARSQVRLVFFTIDQYRQVKSQRYSLLTHRLVLLTQGHMYNFLDEFKIDRLRKDASYDEMERFIAQANWDREMDQHVDLHRIHLTERDRTLLAYFCEGKNIAEVAELTQLHLKTIYLMRRNLIEKLGCSGLIDFLHTLRTDVFKEWLTKVHH